jgi:hypothetical protein
MHAIEYDHVRDEIVVPQPFAQAILTFRGGTAGEEAPVRVLQGGRTRIEAPDRVGIDPVNGEIYVPEGDKLLVFPREAAGDVAPIRVLAGPDTQLGATAVTVDPVNNLLIVGGSSREPRGGQILIFDRTAAGNTKPRAVIRGPRTGLKSNVRSPRVYSPGGWIVAGHSGEEEEKDSFVGIWSIHDNGDVAPRWTIGGPSGSLFRPRGIALDPANQAVIVSDKKLNAVMTYHVPELFTRSPSAAGKQRHMGVGVASLGRELLHGLLSKSGMLRGASSQSGTLR